MRAPVLLVVAVLTGAACDVPTVPPRLASEVYDFRLGTTPPAVLRWPSGSTIRVHVAGGPQANRAQLLLTAFDTGARAWNERALYAEYELVSATQLSAADVVLRWSDESPPVITTDCVPVLGRAATTFCLTNPDPAQARLHVFPLLNDEAPSNVRMIVTILGAEAAQSDRVMRLVAHELGHVLGLAQHSLNAQDLMYGGDLTRATLSVRDASTVQILYQTRPTIVP